jgi:hypothetical protein
MLNWRDPDWCCELQDSMQGPTRRNYRKQVSEGDSEGDTFFAVHLLFYHNPFLSIPYLFFPLKKLLSYLI